MLRNLRVTHVTEDFVNKKSGNNEYFGDLVVTSDIYEDLDKSGNEKNVKNIQNYGMGESPSTSDFPPVGMIGSSGLKFDIEEGKGNDISESSDDEDDNPTLELITKNFADDGHESCVPSTIYDILSVNEIWVEEKIKNTMKWLIIIPIKLCIFIGFLIVLSCLYGPYIRDCEPHNNFSKFSFSILSYTIIQQILDIFLAVVSLRGLTKILRMKAFDKINDLTALQPTSVQENHITHGSTTYTDINPAALYKTGVMGKIAEQYLNQMKSLNYTPIAEESSGDEIISKTTLREAMRDLRDAAVRFSSGISSLNNPCFRTKRVSDSLRSPIDLGSEMIGFGGKILITFNLMPLMSIFFYILIGSNSIKELENYRESLRLNNTEDVYTFTPAICKANITLNCLLILILLSFNLGRIVPIFYRAINMAVKKRA